MLCKIQVINPKMLKTPDFGCQQNFEFKWNLTKLLVLILFLNDYSLKSTFCIKIPILIENNYNFSWTKRSSTKLSFLVLKTFGDELHIYNILGKNHIVNSLEINYKVNFEMPKIDYSDTCYYF